jgi:hypothetical protein
MAFDKMLKYSEKYKNLSKTGNNSYINIEIISVETISGNNGYISIRDWGGDTIMRIGEYKSFLKDKISDIVYEVYSPDGVKLATEIINPLKYFYYMDFNTVTNDNQEFSFTFNANQADDNKIKYRVNIKINFLLSDIDKQDIVKYKRDNLKRLRNRTFCTSIAKCCKKYFCCCFF